MPGLKVTVDGTFKPASGGMAGKLKTEYKHERLLVTSDMGLTASPVINCSASVGHGPWALGYSTAFDTGKAAIVTNNLASATLPTIWFFMSPPTTLRCSVVESTTRSEPDSKLELPLTLPLPETPTLELVASMLWEMMLVLEQRLITLARLDLAISRA